MFLSQKLCGAINKQLSPRISGQPYKCCVSLLTSHVNHTTYTDLSLNLEDFSIRAANVCLNPRQSDITQCINCSSPLPVHVVADDITECDKFELDHNFFLQPLGFPVDLFCVCSELCSPHSFTGGGEDHVTVSNKIYFYSTSLVQNNAQPPKFSSPYKRCLFICW